MRGMNCQEKFNFLDTEVLKSYDKTKLTEGKTLSELRILCAEAHSNTFFQELNNHSDRKEGKVFFHRHTSLECLEPDPAPLSCLLHK